jgi:hypothetical protein
MVKLTSVQAVAPTKPVGTMAPKAMKVPRGTSEPIASAQRHAFEPTLIAAQLARALTRK